MCIRDRNTPVVYADVTIENPDGNIFLGIEGKAEILTGSAEDVYKRQT